MSTGDSAIINLTNVDISNHENVVLKEVNLSIYNGEFVFLIGKVGSGKSSLIKALIAEFPIDKGEGYVAGYNLKKIKRREIPYLRRKIGVVFQDFQLLMDRSVEENLLFVLEATGWGKKKTRLERVKEVLDLVGMGDKINKMPHQLSGGEQQRVAVARALLNNPEIILADEPTGNLDRETADEIMGLFMEIHQKKGTPILMVTHNRELFRRYEGRVLLCDNSSIEELNDSYEEGIEIEL